MVNRQRRPPVIATQRVSMKPAPGGKGVKAKQAWKYPGFNIVRASTVWLNDRYYSDPKEADSNPGQQGELRDSGMAPDDSGTPRRKQESNFLITINPNKKFTGTQEPAAERAFRVALGGLSTNTSLVRCLKFGPKDAHYAKDRAADVILPGVQWTANVETGENLGRMHSHIWLTIEHYSQIQINVPMMQHEFVRQFNASVVGGQGTVLTGVPYIDVKLLPQSDWTTVMRQYIKKGMTA